MIKQFNISDNRKKSKTNAQERVNNVLALYTELQEDGGVDRDVFCERHNISVRTFTRYIATIKGFLQDYDDSRWVYVNEHGNYEIYDSYK